MSHQTGTLLIQGVMMIVLVVLIVGRQLRTRRVTTRQLVRFPLIFGVIGVLSLGAAGLSSTAGGTLLAGELTLAVVLGIARGATTTLCRDATGWWSKGTAVTAVLWVVSFAVRFAAVPLSGTLGSAAGMGTGAIFLFVAATFAAQNIVLAHRTGALSVGSGPAESPATHPARPRQLTSAHRSRPGR